MEVGKNGPEQNKNKKANWNIKPYLAMGLVALLVIFCSIAFFFVIFRYDGLSHSWKQAQRVLQPIVFGIVFAYLMSPIVKAIERFLKKILGGKIKKPEKEKSVFRWISILVSLSLVLTLISILLRSVIPELYRSIEGLVVSLPDQVNATIHWMQSWASEESKLAEFAEQFLIAVTAFMEKWIKTDLLPQSKMVLTLLTSGVISVVKALLNIIIGLMISIYLLREKELFVARGKKTVYALFSPKTGNVLVQTVRKSHEIFIGFISGKIIDSIIIGILCFIILSLVSMPYALLVSVIVGVTNVVPFFGPYIGAVPSFILILLTDPMKSIYFLVIILILQQVDGNIIGPKILGNSTGLSAFWVIFAILVGGGFFGFIGMLVGVPAFAIFYYIMGKLIRYCLRRRNLPEYTRDYEEVKSVDVENNKLVK